MGFFDKLKIGLGKTKSSLSDKMNDVFSNFRKVDEDLLEDAIIENKQAIEMSKIYSDILNETMDMYASIISNNINDIMKFLTSITIILAIPTLVASIWGMNVPVPLAHSAHGFLILVIVSLILTIFGGYILGKKNMF